MDRLYPVFPDKSFKRYRYSTIFGTEEQTLICFAIFV